MLDVTLRDWLRARNEVMAVCESVDLAGDVKTKVEYPRLTVAVITDPRNQDLDGQTNERITRVQIDVWSEKGQIGSEIAELLVGDDEADGLLQTNFVGTAVGTKRVLDVDVDDLFRRSESTSLAKGKIERIDRVTIDLLIALQ